MKIAYPEETNFGKLENIGRPAKDIYAAAFSPFSSKEVFAPASEDKIITYQEELYPAWQKRCSEIFRNLHSQLNYRTNWPEIEVAIQNIGSRPAVDALTTFSTRGPLLIFPTDTHEKLLSRLGEEVLLPLAPVAPQGAWKQVDIFSIGSTLRDLMGKEIYNSGYNSSNLARLSKLASSRDQNKFYWKPERPDRPEPTITLECQQWRHQIGNEYFKFFIRTDLDAGEYEGALELRIDSANMTESVEKRIAIKINITVVGALDVARGLVKKSCR